MLYTISRRYKVPAKKGQPVRFTDVSGKQFIGRVVGAIGSNLAVKFMGKPGVKPVHPEWNVEYL